MCAAYAAYQANGGRVLAVTGVGSDLTAAMTAAYKGVEAITFTPSHYRKDIGYRAKQAPLRIGGTVIVITLILLQTHSSVHTWPVLVSHDR
jgi:Phosphoribosylglycinamide synthetase, C domain